LTGELRTGIGYDAHRFDAARALWVAGLEWPGEPGLAGHSDGDVAAHACCDALLSAAGMGDLGAQYGTSDPRWRGASGVALLAETANRVTGDGWTVVNVAVQVVGETPRVGTRRAEAEAALSQAAGAPVSVSGTTTDGLGFTGGREGLAAVATALLRRTT
jgi:2-C-methyl-D-erythritol 2,4-cyclodiphosphate synthase